MMNSEGKCQNFGKEISSRNAGGAQNGLFQRRGNYSEKNRLRFVIGVTNSGNDSWDVFSKKAGKTIATDKLK